MTVEEKKEILKKLSTQIDGAECYIRQLQDAENNDTWESHMNKDSLDVVMIRITQIRMWLENYSVYME